MSNKTYEYYGAVLKGTPYFTEHGERAYLPYSKDFSLLNQPVSVGKYISANRIEYQPMEGQDALPDGSPSEKTLERYCELARGGAGLLWAEAVSVCESGKSNPYQLCITEKNLDSFKRLAEEMKTACIKQNGFEPIILLQLNHSGRYSKPNGTPEPITAYFNPDIESAPKRIITDEELRALPDLFAKSTRLTAEAGFDGVDIKACHGYLVSEFLSAYDREGAYGGSFENRSRLFREIIKAAFCELPQDKIRAARIGVFDGYSGKYSFGKPENGGDLYDLTEADLLIEAFKSSGGQLLNVTMGSPYRNPEVSRPYRCGLDRPQIDEIFALYRLWQGAAELKRRHSELKTVNTGISLLGAMAPYAAAGAVAEDMTDFVGFGRMSFAYPNLARDIINNKFDEKQVCVACSGCSTLKKNVLPSGCIIRNDYYKQVFRNWKKEHENE